MNIKELLLSTNRFEDCIALNEYVKLIESEGCKDHIAYETQNHHIIPKSLTKYSDCSHLFNIIDSVGNIVNLHIDSHLKAHYLLYISAIDKQTKNDMQNAVKVINGKIFNKFIKNSNEERFEDLNINYRLWLESIVAKNFPYRRSDEELLAVIEGIDNDFFNYRNTHSRLDTMSHYAITKRECLRLQELFNWDRDVRSKLKYDNAFKNIDIEYFKSIFKEKTEVELKSEFNLTTREYMKLCNNLNLVKRINATKELHATHRCDDDIDEILNFNEIKDFYCTQNHTQKETRDRFKLSCQEFNSYIVRHNLYKYKWKKGR